MSRRELESHLREHGCELHHHGAKHDVWWNPVTSAMSAVPRHKTIKKGTVRSICRALDVPFPPNL